MRAHDEIQGKEGIEVLRQEGNFLFLKGHPIPFRGAPTIEEVELANVFKDFIKKRDLHMLREAGDIVHASFISEGFTSDVGSELKTVGWILDMSSLSAIAYILDKDAAYRWRFQDLVSETTLEDLTARPFREVRRLLKIYMQRENEEQRRKFKKLCMFLPLLLLIPRNRQKFRQILKACDFSKFKTDYIDRYWMRQRFDYAFGQPENVIK